MAILQNQTNYVDGGALNGGAFTTDTRGAFANSGNTAYGGSVTSVEGMKGAGMYSVTGSGGSPSFVKHAFPAMGGGGRRRRRSKTSRKSRKNRYSRSRKYGRKRGSKRITRSRSRSRRGGYAQYMTGLASAFCQSIPGFPLSSKMSALANPPPFRPYQNCPGGL